MRNHLSNDNKIVHGLWIGEELSPLELLTIRSFVRQGHEFHLWLYDELKTALPKETIVHDASEIIPSKDVFSYVNSNEWGHGKGSYAGFSDIFRYKLLYEYGGWWVDMDVTCLQPLAFDTPYFFRSHDVLNMVGNVMKCPKGSALMKDCYDEAKRKISKENTAWLMPIEILNQQIKEHGLSDFIYHRTSNLDRWEVIEKLLRFNSIKKEWYFIHWLNEEWRSRKVPKHSCIEHSALAYLYKQHHDDLSIEFIQIPYIILVLQTFWKDVVCLWWNKFLNWLRQPGIPVFVKRWMGK